MREDLQHTEKLATQLLAEGCCGAEQPRSSGPCTIRHLCLCRAHACACPGVQQVMLTCIVTSVPSCSTLYLYLVALEVNSY